MAKNGPNDLIFGKLIISNDFKRFDWGFLKISIFGRFFAFLGWKRLNGALDNHIGYLYIQSELYWSIAPGVYRLLVSTKMFSFWAIFGHFGSVHEIFSDSRTKNRWKIKIFQIRSIGFLIIIITNHKPKIRSIGSFLVSSIDFEWAQYCSKWANFRLFLYIKCLQVHELKLV